MDPRIFRDEPMQLEETLLGLGLAERDQLRRRAQHPVPNLEGMHVRTRDDVDRVRRVVEDGARRSATRSRWSSTTTTS